MVTCYKRLSFSNDEEFRLIEFVKSHPALWDASHGEYGNSELRKQYWVELATELNKTIFECRRKWRFVRDYYIHKRRRHGESTPQRDGKYYSLQFLNKIKVSSKKFPSNSKESTLRRNESQKSATLRNLDKIEVDFVDTDEELDYNFLDDPTVEKITVERIGSEGNINDVGENNNCTDTYDDKSEDFSFKEDYIDESSVADDFGKFDNNNSEGEADGQEDQLVVETHRDTTDNVATDHQTNNSVKTDSSSSLHEKAIDLFFESMAAAVKTFPPQYVAEAKLKVFMALNEIESKVYKHLNKN